jgi:hypothetical protein
MLLLMQELRNDVDGVELTNRGGKGIATLKLQVMNKVRTAISINNGAPENKN